eukprot:TRINITY_DN537_c4_g1_i1.p1 TRINITY_DN537_c4_g1~~TRINITY_DN537_c4_g1_i1.p1  ORF type:complete len:516 (+),score=179.41 TRINITY_DN537_c4_g1_i1:48-1550(+)
MEWSGKQAQQQGSEVQPEHKVVLVKALPPEVSAEDVIHHALKCGKVMNRFVQEKTRHLFVEMESREHAQQLVTLLEGISVKGHQLRCELSQRYAQVTEEKVNRVLVLSLPGLVDGTTDCHQLASLLGSKGGRVLKIQLWASKDGVVQGLVEMDSNESAQVLREQLSGYMMGSATVRLSYSNKQTIEIKQRQYGFDFVTNEGSGMCPRMMQPMPHPQQMPNRPGMRVPPSYPPMPGHPMSPLHNGVHDGTCTVLVKNLIEGVPPEALFRLFGICGDVRAVKIMFKRRSSALIEYTNPRGAMKACQLLQGCPFYEDFRTLQVMPAKLAHITGPEDDLTKYYTESPHHRFSGRSAQKNLENMHGPNVQLHISNVPVGIPDETVENALKQYSDFATTRWIENKANVEARTKMCIATLESIRSAVAALMGLHTICFSGHPPANGKGIVVSFSKRTMQKPARSPSEGIRQSPEVGANGLIPDPTRASLGESPRYKDATGTTVPGHP